MVKKYVGNITIDKEEGVRLKRRPEREEVETLKGILRI